MPATYYQLSKHSTQHQTILLQARCLQAQMFHYDTSLSFPLSNPSIYLSSNVNELPIVIDTGASFSITPTITDFDQSIARSACTSLNQLSGKTPVIGEGPITWNIEDVEGTRRQIKTHAYYVPTATIRLFSPQTYIGTDNKAQLLLDSTGISLTLKCGSLMQFPLNKASNLPFMLTETAVNHTRPKTGTSHFTSFQLFQSLFQSPFTPIIPNGHESPKSQTTRLTTVKDVFNTFNTRQPVEGIFNSLARKSVINRDNFNLKPQQQELLLWHCRLGHTDFQRVQSLLRKPHVPRGAIDHGHLHSRFIVPTHNDASSCQPPKCEACQYAKQKRTTPLNPKHKDADYREGMLSLGKTDPGDCISCDQYMSTTLGRLSHTLGREDKSRQLVGGTMFVDHATNFIFHRHQVNLTSAESIRSKHSLEAHLLDHGIVPQHFSSDNHPFTSKEWIADCNNQHQQRSLSGVGAHHQNYMERHIQTIFNWARSSLLHFVLHWPQQAQENLWPFAIDYSVYLWNTMPARDGLLSPTELLDGTTFPNYHHLQRTHVFGCPVFILDPRLQDSKKIPKWSMRSKRGIYLGVSPFHSSTVHLVLNPSTGSITPQYHLVFDDSFSTVFSNGQFDEAAWLNLLHHGHELHPTIQPDSTGNITLPPDCVPFDAAPASSSIPEGEAIAPTTISDSQQLQSTHFEPLSTSSSEGESPPSTEGVSPHSPTKGVSSPLLSSEVTSSSSSPLRRSQRSTAGQPPPRLTFLASYDAEHDIHRPHIPGSTRTAFSAISDHRAPRISGERRQHSYLANLKWNALLIACSAKLSTLQAFVADHQHSLSYTANGIPLVNVLNPAIFQTMATKTDTPTFTEAMNGPDAAGFLKAMEIKMTTLIQMETFDVIQRTHKLNVISSVWAFKIKRFPDGSVKKLKARLCARGFEQVEGRDYFETFAPVVQWLTVRLILIMTILLGLENQQIDYTAAFVQAPIDTDVYVEMPRLFSTPGKVWKLKKSIYGLKQSPRNYFLYMKAKLEKLGFAQSIADPCLFISPTVICLIYVDDALLVYRDQQAVDILAGQMEQEKMLFQVESDVAGYLGVLIDRRSDGSIVMRQEGLAKRIVEALFLDDKSSSSVRTPATAYLPIDEEGEPAQGLYNYASVVGMLNYLQGHSRIDISFAVSQVARYVHSPRRSHELALERIGRYLKGTLDQGLILRPTSLEDRHFTIDVYVDAAFACGWGTEQGTNPESVKSRTGYIIEVMGCSVVWCSKLQTSIATSTMESEYTALSMALRAAIPLMAVSTSINKGLGLIKDKFLTFKATVHEDNLGALTLATLEPGRHTPRSKFYALKLHWFRSWMIPNEIGVIHCPTKDQKADYLTKPLTASMFEACRRLSMGW